MQSQNELRNLLQRIDHKSYPAYKDTRGSYDFGNYVLSIDHVQGDPFAAPSKVSVHVRGGAAKFPADLYRMKCRRLAVCDYLLRQFGRELERVSFKAKGSGKSGLLAVSRPGQEVLERTACQMDEAKGDLVLRFEVGFPANGRTVNARELEKIFFTFLPECVSHSLFYKALDEKAVYRAADLAEDQQYIRDHLKEQGLVAFVADGSILPRESGVSGRPMKDAVKFTAPESMKVSFALPHAGRIQGMGIKKGITLIVGGGYHGKSTLLKIIMKQENPDEGEVTLAKDKTIGYLAQYQDVSGHHTIYEEVLDSKRDIIEMEERLRDMETQMNTLSGEALEQLLDTYHKLSHEFEQVNGYAYRSEVTGILKGLGFTEEEFDKKMNELSGGQKTRVSL